MKNILLITILLVSPIFAVFPNVLQNATNQENILTSETVISNEIKTNNIPIENKKKKTLSFESSTLSYTDGKDPRSISSHISVISEDEIRMGGYRSVSEIISPALGVHIERQGSIMQTPSISVRGTSPKQILIFVNGSRTSSADAAVVLSAISANNIEKIEIIRGATAAGFGENAFGAAINIITKDGFRKNTEFTAGYDFGSFNTHSLQLGIRGPIGKKNIADYFFSANGLYTKGNYGYEDINAEELISYRSNSGGISGSLNGGFGFNINKEKAIRLEISSLYYRDKKGAPGLMEFPSEEAIMQDERLDIYSSFGIKKSKIVNLEVFLSGGIQNRRYTDEKFFMGAIDDFHGLSFLKTSVEVSRKDYFKYLIMKNTLVYDFKFDSLLSTALTLSDGTLEGGEITRFSHSTAYKGEFGFFPYETKVARFSLFPAFRGDFTKDFDFSPNISLGLNIAFDKYRKTVFKANAGSTYRLPTFNDLFWTPGAFAAGNPSLLPEKAFIYDIGILTKPVDMLSLEITHFGQYASNLIIWNASADGRFRPSNLGQAHIRGIEFETTLLFPFSKIKSFLEMKGNYSYTFATDTTEGASTYGKQIIRRPYEKANILLTLSHSMGHSLRVEGHYTGFRYITSANTKYLPAVFTMDASLLINLFSRLDLQVTGRNLFDKRYIDMRGYPIAGREITVSANFTYR